MLHSSITSQVLSAPSAAAIAGEGSLLYGGAPSRRQRSADIPGHVAEWLRNGLQNRVPRFNSGRGLHFLRYLQINPRRRRARLAKPCVLPVAAAQRPQLSLAHVLVRKTGSQFCGTCARHRTGKYAMVDFAQARRTMV